MPDDLHLIATTWAKVVYIKLVRRQLISKPRVVGQQLLKDWCHIMRMPRREWCRGWRLLFQRLWCLRWAHEAAIWEKSLGVHSSTTDDGPHQSCYGCRSLDIFIDCSSCKIGGPYPLRYGFSFLYSPLPLYFCPGPSTVVPDLTDDASLPPIL